MNTDTRLSELLIKEVVYTASVLDCDSIAVIRIYNLDSDIEKIISLMSLNGYKLISVVPCSHRQCQGREMYWSRVPPRVHDKDITFGERYSLKGDSKSIMSQIKGYKK